MNQKTPGNITQLHTSQNHYKLFILPDSPSPSRIYIDKHWIRKSTKCQKNCELKWLSLSPCCLKFLCLNDFFDFCLEQLILRHYKLLIQASAYSLIRRACVHLCTDDFFMFRMGGRAMGFSASILMAGFCVRTCLARTRACSLTRVCMHCNDILAWRLTQ